MMAGNTSHSFIGRRQLVQFGLGAAGALALYGVASAPTQNANAEAATTFNPGTYVGQGEGRRGKVSVEVSFSEDAIETIDLADNMETPRIVDAAFESISQQVLATQGLAIDTVTGATFSSNAVVSAIEDCVAQAGGDVAAMRAVTSAPNGGQGVELDADIVVIGGGGAGMGQRCTPHSTAPRWRCSKRMATLAETSWSAVDSSTMWMLPRSCAPR